jgi:HEXXH motif-containing protein
MDLTYPSPGSTTLRQLMPRVATRIVQQYLALPDAPGDTLRHAARAAAHEAVRRDAAELAAILTLPTNTALLGAVLHDGAAASGALAALDLAVLFELSAADAPQGERRVARPGAAWPAILSPRAGVRVTLKPGVRRATFAPDAVALEDGAALSARAPVPTPHADVEPAYLPLRGGVQLALFDNNPLAAVPLHPERAGNAWDLGGHAPALWCARLNEALALVERFLPALYAEFAWLLRVIVPVGAHDELHASCSYEDALGAIYLTLHPSPLKLAEALVHEFQHNKLHAALRLDPLLHNARTSRYRSPLRPDARPLAGLLMAVHAFLPVTMLYRAVGDAGHPLSRSRDFRKQCDGVARVYRDGAATLYAAGEPTRLGAALFAEMRALAARLDAGP